MATDKIKLLEKKLKVLRSKSNKGVSGRRKVNVLNELAYALYTSDPEKTEGYATEALALAEKLDYVKGIAKSYHIIGISYAVRSDYDCTLEYFRKALKIRMDIGDSISVAHICHCIGNIHLNRSDGDQALEYYLKALKIYEEIGENIDIANSYNGIGTVYSWLRDYEQALEYHFKSLKIYEEIGDKKGIASSYSNIGSIYETQGDYDQALEYSLKGFKVFEEIGDKVGMANACSYIGGIHYYQSDYKQALEYYLKAFKIRKEIGQKSGFASSYNDIGRTHMKLKRYDSALSHLQKGLQFAREIRAKNREIDSYEYLSELFEAQADYEHALSYHKKYADLEKEIFNAEKSKQIAEMRTRYETEKKEKEAEIYHLKNVKLRKEIKERKKAEKALKKHRDQLEKLVADRTAQLRSLAHELSLVEEKQRRKIATYLHDVINQKLGLAAFRLEALEEVTPVKNVRREQKEIKKIVDQAAQLTRSLTFEISPPVLYEFGLEAAFEWLVRQFSKQYRITCDFKDDGKPKPVSDETRILLFQSVRELLANISKHARANHVTVSTAKENNYICVSVKDDGVGFDTRILNKKIAHNEGFGLFNLTERLRHARGKLEVVSKKGQGTSVAIIVPLHRMTRRTSKDR
jgi:signal transduction histidine kinase